MEEKRLSQRFSQQALEGRGKDSKEDPPALIDPLSHVWLAVVCLISYTKRSVAHLETDKYPTEWLTIEVALSNH